MAPGARRKIGAPIFGSEALIMYWIEESSCDIVGTFCAPRCHSAPGELCSPCPQSLRPCFV